MTGLKALVTAGLLLLPAACDTAGAGTCVPISAELSVCPSVDGTTASFIDATPGSALAVVRLPGWDQRQGMALFVTTDTGDTFEDFANAQIRDAAAQGKTLLGTATGSAGGYPAVRARLQPSDGAARQVVTVVDTGAGYALFSHEGAAPFETLFAEVDRALVVLRVTT